MHDLHFVYSKKLYITYKSSAKRSNLSRADDLEAIPCSKILPQSDVTKSDNSK